MCELSTGGDNKKRSQSCSVSLHRVAAASQLDKVTTQYQEFLEQG